MHDRGNHLMVQPEPRKAHAVPSEIINVLKANCEMKKAKEIHQIGLKEFDHPTQRLIKESVWTCSKLSYSPPNDSGNDRANSLNTSENSAFVHFDSNDPDVVTLETFANKDQVAVNTDTNINMKKLTSTDSRVPSDDSTYLFITSKSQVSPDGWMRLVSASAQTSPRRSYFPGDRDWKFNSICQEPRKQFVDQWEAVEHSTNRSDTMQPSVSNRVEDEASPLRMTHEAVMMESNSEACHIQEQNTNVENGCIAGWLCEGSTIWTNLACCSPQACSFLPGFQMFRICFSSKS
eukprot:766400-Hanusia_phi.AAC.10